MSSHFFPDERDGQILAATPKWQKVLLAIVVGGGIFLLVVLAKAFSS